MKSLILTFAALALTQGAFAADKTAAAPDGKALFLAKCASCHAKDATGNPAMAKMYKLDQSALNLVGLKIKDEDFTKIVKGGKKPMPKFDKLSDPETAAIIAYVRSLSPAKAESK